MRFIKALIKALHSVNHTQALRTSGRPAEFGLVDVVEYPIAVFYVTSDPPGREPLSRAGDKGIPDPATRSLPGPYPVPPA